MSYTIVKSISIKRRQDGKGFEISMTSSDSKSHPLRYSRNTFGEFATKTEAEREIVRNYRSGNFQGGNNKKYRDIDTLARVHPKCETASKEPVYIRGVWKWQDGTLYAEDGYVFDYLDKLRNEACEKAFAIYEAWEKDKNRYYIKRDHEYSYLNAIYKSGRTRWSIGTQQARRYTRANAETILIDHNHDTHGRWTLERVPVKQEKPETIIYKEVTA